MIALRVERGATGPWSAVCPCALGAVPAPGAPNAGSSLAGAGKTGGMSEDLDDEMLQEMHEQDELEPDVEVLHAYAEEHPDVWGGYEFDNSAAPVGLVAFVTEDVDEHATRLRSRVQFPARLQVRRVAMSERDRQVLARNLFERLQAALPDVASLGIGHAAGGKLSVMLPEGCDAVADELEREYGDVLIIERGVIYRPLASGDREADPSDA